MYETAVKYLLAIPEDKADDAVHFNLGWLTRICASLSMPVNVTSKRSISIRDT